ncbi:MAG: riboflavin kinase/FMN adenylyltransferase [Flavobacterium sp.]
MTTFFSISDFKSSKKTILTIGTYDGVHLGHQKILKKMISEGLTSNLETALISFFPHPRMVLQQNSNLQLLNTLEEKKVLLEKNGIQNLIVHPFDQEFSELSAEEFVKEYLVKQLSVAKIIIGYDHRFGKNRTAGIADLQEFGIKYGFEVEQISVKEINEISISSTKIREAVKNGAIKKANSYLGYSYFFSGNVVKGKQIGRTIGFPTANIEIKESYKLIPESGVFVVAIKIKSIVCPGIMNIGNQPTVNGNSKRIEVHVLNFSDDLYDQNVTVCILDFIREEEKFDSLENLKSQLEKDKEFALSYFHNFRGNLQDYIF